MVARPPERRVVQAEEVGGQVVGFLVIVGQMGRRERGAPGGELGGGG